MTVTKTLQDFKNASDDDDDYMTNGFRTAEYKSTRSEKKIVIFSTYQYEYGILLEKSINIPNIINTFCNGKNSYYRSI